MSARSPRGTRPDAAPTLGVVIPTLGEEATVGRLLARLGVPGEDGADQVVVADGGSLDATREVARERGAEVLEAPRGRGAQLAAGAGALATDVLVFLHADCVPEPGALAALRRAFADTGLGAAGMSQRIDAPGRFYRFVERAADRRVERGMVYGDSGLAVRRASYEVAGGFRALPLFEDVDLSHRLRSHARPRLVPAARLVVSPRRWHREGPLQTTLRNWILRAAFELGVSPERLVRYYAPHSERPASP